MTEQEKKQLAELIVWKKQMENSNSIPLNIDQSFRARFNIPIITKATLDFANTNSQQSSTLSVTIKGVGIGDAVHITPPSASLVGNLGGIFIGYVSAANTVSIRFINPDTGSSLNPGSGVYTITIFKT